MRTQTPFSSSRSQLPKKTRTPVAPVVLAPPTPLMATVVAQPSLAAKQSSQAGWDYWTRVYSEDSPVTVASRDIRISDMLSSDTLVRAKLIFLNVPTLPSAHKNIILNLVKRELRDEISIQDVVVVAPGKWYLNFYRPEDALRVLKHFNGFNYRGHVLAVRFCYPDGTFGDETALAALVECSNQSKGRLLEKKEIIQDTFVSECWTVAEHEALLTFEAELMKILQVHAYLPYHSVLQSMKTLFPNKPSSTLASFFISEALTQWPTGFVRVFNRNVKVVANTMCLSTSSYYAQRIHDSALEGGCSIHRNSWEPFVPDDIRCDAQLVQYVQSFLKHFGPQHVDIDVPIRILAQSLRGTWPKSGYELAELLTEISSGFVLINCILYLSNNETHHEKVIDNLANFQDDCTDVYFLPLACTSEEQKVKLVDYEDL